MNMEWIKLTERVPSKTDEKWVLVYCEFGVQLDLYIPNHGFENYHRDNITHWMELPPEPNWMELPTKP